MGALALREYQERAITLTYEWMAANEGNCVVSLPTGSGKSVVIAELCRQAVTQWPDTRILMLTRSIELVTQNAEKLRTIWPGAPMGIYSASAGRKQLGEPITIGGPLSIVNVVERLGHIDLCIVDEAHDISHRDEGSYRKIINHLLTVNPAMRVVGFTASPYRLGHGLITDKPALFDGLIEPTSIADLIRDGYLSLLRSKQTHFQLSTDGVKKRGGEFIEADLQRAVDTADNNARMVDEVIARAGERKSWMVFCTGVEHARHIADLLNERGVSAVAVTGDMPKAERERAVSDFRAGRIRCVTNVNCLSTGFDHPSIDLLVLARPSMSPGTYIQQVGRGLRIAPDKADCLVLDFAKMIETHGPITSVRPPKKAGKGTGEAPVKVCDHCHELVHPSVKVCPCCGAEFPPPKPKPLTLGDDDIMGLQGHTMRCRAWSWRVHQSKTSGRDMLLVTYYGALSDAPIREYITIGHDGNAGLRAWSLLAQMAAQSGASVLPNGMDGIVLAMNAARPPVTVEYRKDGKFFRVMQRSWNNGPV